MTYQVFIVRKDGRYLIDARSGIWGPFEASRIFHQESVAKLASSRWGGEVVVFTLRELTGNEVPMTERSEGTCT